MQWLVWKCSMAAWLWVPFRRFQATPAHVFNKAENWRQGYREMSEVVRTQTTSVNAFQRMMKPPSTEMDWPVT
ncbi:hypothetical protein D3C79_595360 [compost metagenome]